MSLVELMDSLKKKTYSDRVDELARGFRKNLPSAAERSTWKGNAKSYYDYSPFGENNRIAAIKAYVEEAKKRLHGIVSDAQIEAYFAFSNMLIVRGGYNASIDFLNLATLSASIWILDNLALQGKVEEIYSLLPKLDEEHFPNDLLTAPANHLVYDESLVMSLVHLIRHRNTSKEFSDITCGTLVWEKGKVEQDSESQANRKAFDAIIRLLDPDAVKKAIAKYEGDIWRFYRITFAIYSKLETSLANMEKEREQLNSQLFPVINLNSVKANPLLMNPQKSQANPIIKSSARSQIEDRIEQLDRRIESFSTQITLTDFSLVNDREKSMKRLAGIASKELRQELIGFHVDDPFESSFALLYLLDSGSLIPWMYYGSISVAYTMIDQLPFDSSTVVTKEPVLLSQWSDALYEHRYNGYRWDDRTDADGEPIQRTNAKNLSQLFYKNAQALFPRVVPSQPMLEAYLSDLGDLSDREKEAYSLLLFMLNAASLHFDGNIIEEVLEDADKTPAQLKEAPSVDQDALRAENERLRSKNRELASALKILKQQKKTSDNNLVAAKTELSEKSQELTDLRELVFLLDNKEVPEEPVDETIQYPFITPGKILSFGGHPSWIKEMKKKLSNVVFIDPDTLPNADLIRSADTIWIQTNYISHSNFYKIINAVGASGKQVRYFTSTSSAKCAEQVVKSLK